MSHKKSRTVNPQVTERFGTPRMQKGDDGNPLVLCPFCSPSHPLSAVGVSACGTQLQLRAVQTVYHAKYRKDMVCIKCQKGGGDMVMFNNAFVHVNDCSPGVATFIDPPKFSRMASLVFRMPNKIKTFTEKYLGETKAVEEVDEKGVRTGKTLGHFFYVRSKT